MMQIWKKEVENKKLNRHIVQAPAGELGLSFDDELAVTAVARGGAMELKVAIGWKLLHIDGRSVTGKAKADVQELLDSSAATERELFFQLPTPPELNADLDGTITVAAPAGKLGLTLRTSMEHEPKGAVVEAVFVASPLAGSVQRGMTLLAVDGVDMTSKNNTEAVAFLVERAEQRERKLKLLLPPAPPPPKPYYREPFFIFLAISLVVSLLGMGAFYFLRNISRSHTQEAMGKAQKIFSGLAANQELGLSREFLQAVVGPALKEMAVANAGPLHGWI